MIRIQDQLYHVSSHTHEKYRQYYIQGVDLKTFPLKKQEELIHIPVDDSKRKKTFSLFTRSLDGEGVGLLYGYPTKDSEPRKFSPILFDTTLQKQAEYSYSFPYTQEELYIHRAVLHTKDEMILLVEYPNLDKPPLSTSKIDYQILSLKQGKIKTLARIPTDGKWMLAPYFEVTDSTLRVIGLYGDVPRKTRGILYHQVNRSDTSQVIHRLHQYGEDILDLYHGRPLFADKKVKNLEPYRNVPHLFLKGTISYPDGAVMTLVEQTFISSGYVTYKHLVITLFDLNGQELWSTFIKKDNSNDSNPQYSSFTIGKLGENYCIVYNGSIGNLLENDPREFQAFSNKENEAIILVELPRSGEIKKYVLARRADMEEFRFLPSMSGNPNEDTFILYTQRIGKIKEQRFYSIKIQE